MNEAVKKILNEGTPSIQKALFLFTPEDKRELILKKFRLWSRWFFPRFFPSKDAPFHEDIDKGNLEVYLKGGQFLDIGFRGSAKTTRTKLFIAFVIANDLTHYRKFFKCLTKDIGNAKQSVTDIYNMLISKRVRALYGEVFEKTEAKREETMASFTTATGIKVKADTIGTDQRGDIQDESRPDFLWADDFETRLTLTSPVITQKIWENMEEARNGLSKDGGAIYTANYLSERGNVHKLVQKVKNQVIIPIEENGEPTWNRYTKEDLARIKGEAEDYEGEFLCKPSASKDVYFDRTSLEKQVPKVPIDEVAGLKIFRKYDPTHRIGSGHDVGGGIGLDSSTSVFLDFDSYPIQVIATYRNNEIRPDAFAYEIARQAKRFGENYVAVEKNYGSTLDILKGIYPTDKIHKTARDMGRIAFVDAIEYGWECVVPETNVLTSDLRWIKASNLKEGDNIIGPTEEPIKDYRGIFRHRYLTNQKITGLKKFNAKIIRLTLSDGRFIRVSNNHPLLWTKLGEASHWKKAENLKIGDKIYSLPIWEENKSYEAGRLSGLLCGEGYITYSVSKKEQRPNGLNMMISQSAGELADEILDLWRINGFEPNRKYVKHRELIREHHKMMTYTGVGSAPLVLRALGTLRPTRLINKFVRKNLIEALSTKNLPKLEITKIENEVEMDTVIGIETSGHTLITNGLLSHNTNRATKPKMLADMSHAIENGLIELNDEELIEELRGYTSGDLLDRPIDPRLTTRHFDLLMALCIAFQTNSHIKKPNFKPVYVPHFDFPKKHNNPAV